MSLYTSLVISCEAFRFIITVNPAHRHYFFSRIYLFAFVLNIEQTNYIREPYRPSKPYWYFLFDLVVHCLINFNCLLLKDKYKRALADTENLRQRSQKLIDDAKLYGIQGFCKDLLEVADILKKATESVPKTEISTANPHLKNLYDGLVMTEVQIQKVFQKHGLVQLNPDGQKFDPYEHEAVFHAPVEGKEPGTIAVVTKVGYKLHGRTLRPALVGVAKAP